MSGYQSHDDSSDNSECSFPFKYTYGVNAWKHWVKTRQLDEDLLVLDEPKSRKCSDVVSSASCLETRLLLITAFNFIKHEH